MKYKWYWYKLLDTEQINFVLDDIESRPEICTKEPKENHPEFKNVSDVKQIKALDLDSGFVSLFARTVHRINRENFGLDLYYDEPQSFNLNYYHSESKDDYPFHLDSSLPNSMSDIKLTAVLNLSRRPYEGGNFSIALTNQPHIIEEINNPGTLLVFPSFYLHEIAPVTKGVRITMSSWFQGPNWK